MLSFNYVKLWMLLLFLSVKVEAPNIHSISYSETGISNPGMILLLCLMLSAMCGCMKKKAHHGQLDSTPEATDPESVRPLDHTDTWTHDQQAQNRLISNIVLYDCVNETVIDKDLLAPHVA